MELPQDQLKAFFEIARLSSFTKAADHLGLTQSALSHRIKNLESFLGVSLIVRDSDGLRLTEAGTKLMHYARVQRQIEDEFISDLVPKRSKDLSGTLRVGGVSTQMWPIVIPALGKMLRENPDLRGEFTVKEITQLPYILKSGEVDVIVTCGKINLHQYEEIYLGDEISVLAESKKFDAIPDIYLDHDINDRTTIDYLKIHENKIPNLKRSYFDDINGIIAGVEAGLGRAVIPLHILKAYESLRVVKGERKLNIPVYLCFLKQPFYSRLHTHTIETLKKEVPKFLSV